MPISGLFTKGIFRVLYRFAVDGVRLQLGDIVFAQETVVAVLLGVSFTYWGYAHFAESAKLVDFALGFLAYAAIALGFCVGATTVALTLPDRTFMLRLAHKVVPNRPADALSSLLFVFCWTAVVHWFVIVFLLILLATHGHQDEAFFAGHSMNWRVTGGFLVTACSYALMEFLITVLTLWQAGMTFINDLKKQASSSS